jgi:hypothetical protein
MSHALRSVEVPAYVLAVSAGLVLGDGPQRLAAVVVALVLLARVLVHRHGTPATRGSAPFVPAQRGRREVLPGGGDPALGRPAA